MSRVPLSVLDLVGVSADVASAMAASMEAVQVAERAGYARYWFAEHHNAHGVAASATAVLVGQAAARSERIRVGSGGIMLPNHPPLAVAEAFGTIAQLYPGRVDLGLGRAPGTDPLTAAALARSAADPQSFARHIVDLQGWFGPDGMARSARIYAGPARGTEVPIWVLGSTTEGASIAGQLGLPFAVASHFAPAQVTEAIEVYRSTFRPGVRTARIARPHLMVAVNVMACPTSAEAHRQFTSTEQAFAAIRRGVSGLLPPPVDDLATTGTPSENAMAQAMLRYKAVGTPDEVRDQLMAIADRTGADELITVTWAHDPAVRSRSLILTADAWRG